MGTLVALRGVGPELKTSYQEVPPEDHSYVGSSKFKGSSKFGPYTMFVLRSKWAYGRLSGFAVLCKRCYCSGSRFWCRTTILTATVPVLSSRVPSSIHTSTPSHTSSTSNRSVSTICGQEPFWTRIYKDQCINLICVFTMVRGSKGNPPLFRNWAQLVSLHFRLKKDFFSEF